MSDDQQRSWSAAAAGAGNVRLGRRGLLKGMAASGALALLAACGSNATPTATKSAGGAATTAPTAASAGGNLTATIGPTGAGAVPALAGTPGAAGAPGTPGTAAAATAAANAPTVITSGNATTVVWFAGRDTTGYTPKQVEAFNKANKNIQIDYQEQGANTTDLHDKFVTVATAKDSAADIVSMDVPFVPEFAAAGWTIPVDDIMPQNVRSQFFEGTLHGATYDNKLYGVPWFNNGPGLYYRKDLLDAKGLQAPKTYDELLAAAKAVQSADMIGYAMQLNQGEGGIISWFEYLWGYGGDLVDDKMNVVVDKGSAGVDSMQKILDFVYKDKIIPEAALQFSQGADVMNLFAGGKAAMIRLWFSNVSVLYGADAKIKRDQWAVAPLPSKDGGKPGPGCLGDWNLGVSKFSKKQQAALEAIRILTGEDMQKARFLDGGFLPARPAVFDDPQVQEKYPYSKLAQASFANLKPRPVTPFYPEMSKNAIQPAFGQAMARQIPADQAIKQMADKMRSILKS